MNEKARTEQATILELRTTLNQLEVANEQSKAKLTTARILLELIEDRLNERMK